LLANSYLTRILLIGILMKIFILLDELPAVLLFNSALKLAYKCVKTISLYKVYHIEFLLLTILPLHCSCKKSPVYSSSRPYSLRVMFLYSTFITVCPNLSHLKPGGIKRKRGEIRIRRIILLLSY